MKDFSKDCPKLKRSSAQESQALPRRLRLRRRKSNLPSNMPIWMRSLPRNSKNAMSANELSNRKSSILGLRIGFPQVYKSQLDIHNKKRMTKNWKLLSWTRKFWFKMKGKLWREFVLRINNRNREVHFHLFVVNHLPSATCKLIRREKYSSKFWNSWVLPKTNRLSSSSKISRLENLQKARWRATTVVQTWLATFMKSMILADICQIMTYHSLCSKMLRKRKTRTQQQRREDHNVQEASWDGNADDETKSVFWISFRFDLVSER